MKSYVSLFHATPTLFDATVGLWTRMNAYEIIPEIGIYSNPANDQAASYQVWEASYEERIGKEIDWCVKNKTPYVGIGDDLMRMPKERVGMLKWDGKTVEHAAARNNNGYCIGIETVDEIKQDPTIYPLDDLERLWYGAGGPPLGYPGHAPQRFEKRARIISRQWNWWSATDLATMLTRLRASLSDVPRDGRSIVAMIPVVGKCYYKRKPGDEYHRGDQLDHPGISRRQVQMMTEAAFDAGADRLRLYAHDAHWKAERAKARIGQWVQTGITHGSSLWPTVEMATFHFHTRHRFPT